MKVSNVPAPLRHRIIKQPLIQHGSFGGTGLTADLYAAGSDDFRAYIWKLPSTSQLEAQRKILSIEDWESYGDSSLTSRPPSRTFNCG